MTDKSLASKIAIGFFVIWFGILLAGADFPPPPGFIWIVFLDIVAAMLVYTRVPSYINWLENRKKGRFLFAFLDGLAAGFVFALTTMWLPGGGEPSLPPPGWIDRFIWFSVLGIVGAVNAVFIFCVVYIVKAYRRHSA